jgi:hypothetical protein
MGTKVGKGLVMGTKGVNSRHEGSSSYPRPSYIGA